MNKLTVTSGVAALCVLGLTAAAGSHYLTAGSHHLAPTAASRPLSPAAGSHQLQAANADNAAQAASATQASASVAAITTFTAGTSIISGNGDYQLLMQTDGDLVENSLHGISPLVIDHGVTNNDYLAGGNASAGGGNWTVTGTYVGEETTQIWHSNTAGNPGARAVLQPDGNFVVYSASNAVLWSSNTGGHPGATLTVQNDGNAVLYANGQALWATKAVSTVSGTDVGSSTVNFRWCPGANEDWCENPRTLPNGTGVTMLCWEDDPPDGLNPPTDRWFYAVVDGSQDSPGYLNASVVENQTQIRTPECSASAEPAALPPVPATPTIVPPSTSPASAPSAAASTPAPATGAQPPTSGTPSSGASTPTGFPSSGATTPPPSTGTAPPSTGNPPPGTGNPPPATGSAGTYTETVGGPTHTWTDYSDAGGSEGATIPTGQSVQVTCVVQGFKVADGNTNWYQIASSPWSNAYYASSDAFFNNGATSGSLDGTPYVDPNVPAC
jgi:hypothetical protein